MQVRRGSLEHHKLCQIAPDQVMMFLNYRECTNDAHFHRIFLVNEDLVTADTSTACAGLENWKKS